MKPSTILLRNASCVLPSHVLEGSTVVIQEGRFLSVWPDKVLSAPEGAIVVDLSGLALFPGFIDVHMHGASGIDVMDASANDLKVIGHFLPTQGVTAWLPTLVPAADEQYKSAVKTIDQLLNKGETSSDLNARILGVHYEGPFVNPVQCGALHTNHFQIFAHPAQIDALPALASGRMMMTFAPEVEGAIELAQALTKRNWILSVGHTRAGTDVLDRAYEAGARHMTHFMNAMAPLHHRSPGPVAWGLMKEDVTCDIIADGIHLDRYILKMLLKLKGAGGLLLISDAIAAAGKGDGDYDIWGETIKVKNGKTSNAAGSIAGSVITMIDAVRMMRSLGATDVQIGQLASMNPARLLRMDHEIGSIEPGKRADLVALDKDGNVKLTIIGGAVAFENLST